MMPSEFRHQKISLFTDLETLKKEERARRRIIRIQQVRQQSKHVASQVISRTRSLKEKEDHLSRQQKEQKLKEWKHKRLSTLKDELNYGLEVIGESYKAVDKELTELTEKQRKKLLSQKLARERGLIAAREVQRELEEEKLRGDRKRRDREELRIRENIRAKAISIESTPSSPKSSSTQVPELSLPGTSRSSTAGTASTHKSTPSSSTGCDSGNKVEVYNYSQPQHQSNQFGTLPDNVVTKLTPSTCKVGAREQAEQELQAHAERAKERAKQEELSSWLGCAAGTRQTLEKEYASLVQRLPLLSQQEARTKPVPAVTLSEIAQVEEKKARHRSRSQSKENFKPLSCQAEIVMEPRSNGQDAPPPQNFTEFPATQFTEEEAGALGATALSLQVCLDNLAGESRRQLQEVLDEDNFDFYDEDFDEPAPSPPDSPPPKKHLSGTKVTLDVKTKLEVTTEGSLPFPPPTVTSTGQVNITLTSTGKNKRRKSKSKTKSQNLESINSSQNVATTNALSDELIKNKKEENTVSGSRKTAGVVVSDEEVVFKENNVAKSVEIDEHGVAYIKQTTAESPLTQEENIIDPKSKNVNETATRTAESDFIDGQTSYSGVDQFKHNKQSLVSNSTQYHSPPEDMVENDTINNYLKSIEKEKQQVKAFLQSKAKPVQAASEIDLPHYIGKLLTMTRDSVDQLSVSDVTETNSEHSGGRRKKKKKSKGKTMVTASSSSPSTEDSQLTVSVPSPGAPTARTPETSSLSTAQLSSSSSLDSKLKFSDSSSMDQDSTAYLTLQDLSSRVPGKIKLQPTTTNSIADMLSPPDSVDVTDVLLRPLENVRLSTIAEADSSAAADDENASRSALDVEAELRRRGLPVLPPPRNPSPGHVSVETLLSPDLERMLLGTNVPPWGSNMMRRMKQADSLSSSSDEQQQQQQQRLSDSSISAIRRPCHSTPVSMEGGTTSELTTSQSQPFFLQDSAVSPITHTEEKDRRNLSS